MFIRIALFISFLLVSLVGITQDVDREWARWGIPDGFHMEFERLKSDTTILDGQFLAFYKEQLILNGQFEQGLKDGTWRQYSLYSDSVRSEGNYHRGLQDGKWSYYYSNGTQKAEKYYAKGYNVGEHISYHTNGVKRLQVRYENDSLISKLIRYYPNGDTTLIRTFRFSENRWLGSHKSFYDRGPLFETYDFLIDCNNPYLIGRRRTTSLLNLVYLNLDGAKHHFPTPWLSFENSYRKNHATGYLWEHFVYRKGELLNVLQSYNQWGSTQQILHNERGNEFDLIRFQSNGDTLSIESYKDGFRHGKGSIFEHANRKIWEGEFAQNKPTGTWTHFDTNQLPDQSLIFESEEEITVKGIRKDGVVNSQTKVNNGSVDGPFELFDFYNDSLTSAFYVDGLLQGPFKLYRNGKLFKSGAYNNDFPSGTWKTFNPRGKETWSEGFEGVRCSPSFPEYAELSINAKEVSPFSFRPAIIQPKLHTYFTTPFVEVIGGQPFSVSLTEGELYEDVRFEVVVEDIGHVVQIKCIGYSKKIFYDRALSILQQMPFMHPASVEGIPITRTAIVSFNFKEL
ncbi:MAG: hypothetical protein P8H59_11645 [Flavobacteriales bacterium]|nr:hypothetical protein [Flavobacteriales bacterium]MDG1781599.1 hypothetical protein [Flavobacteriales bacterium]